MSIVACSRALWVASAGLALGLAAPAFAQVDETKAESVPACSASVTDHCISHGMMEHHGMMGHHHHHRHHHHRHHHHHKG